MKEIYLDNHSTTKLDPSVLRAMFPYFTNNYGNPSSNHIYGWRATEAVEVSREIIAEIIGCQSNEIIFTSGATEANNMVLKNKKILISEIEHSSVYNIDKYAKKLKVDKDGQVIFEEYNPEIVSIMLVNNEVGVIQDISKLREIYPNSLIHSDMTQALGKIKFDISDVDLASFSAHKLHGPKGIGCLYISSKIQDQIRPLIVGGEQEVGLRAGTLNVPAIVGFGEACSLIDYNMKFKELFLKNLKIEVKIHGRNTTPHSLNIALPCKNMKDFNTLAKDVIFSYGSACDSGSLSRTLLAMGIPEEEILRSIRICFSRLNTEEEIVRAAEIISNAVIASNRI